MGLVVKDIIIIKKVKRHGICGDSHGCSGSLRVLLVDEVTDQRGV